LAELLGSTAPLRLKYRFFLTAISGSDPSHDSCGQVPLNKSLSYFTCEVVQGICLHNIVKQN